MTVLLLCSLAFFVLVFFLILTFPTRIRTVKGCSQEIGGKIKRASLLSLWKLFVGLHQSKDAKSGITQMEFLETFLKDYRMCAMWFPLSWVLLLNYEDIKQVNSSLEFEDRVISQLLNTRQGGKAAGIVQNNGTSWKEMRKYTMKKLGQLGLGKKTQMMCILNEERENLLEHLKDLQEKTGNEILVAEIFELPVINVIWTIAAGQKFYRDDPDFKRLSEHTCEFFKISLFALLMGEFRIFRYLMLKYRPEVLGCDGLTALDSVVRYFQNIVKKRYDSGEYKFPEKNNLIDSFLEEIDFHANSEKKDIYNLDNLVILLVDLFQAGLHTTSETLAAALMWIIKYPEVQRKIQNEIDEVVGRERLPCFFTDLHKMPYTRAALLEVNRMSNIFPMISRVCSKDSLIANLNIRKGTLVHNFYYPVRMSTEFWGDPYEFRPERFLDSENNFIKENVDHILAFGGGSRSCIGEMVAMATIFDFFTAILHRYNVDVTDQKQTLRMRDNAAIINTVVPFRLSISRR